MQKNNIKLTPHTPLSSLPQLAHQIAKEKGWWESDRSKGELVNLVMSEWAEALEGLRNDKISSDKVFFLDVVLGWDDENFKVFFKEHFKGKFVTELGDIVIRLLDWMGREDLSFGFNGDLEPNNYYFPQLDNCKDIQEKMSLLRNQINSLQTSPHLTLNIIHIIIICEDLARSCGCELKEYILIKIKKNLSRSYKHGGKKF